MTKIRILYLIGGRRIGGTETHVRRLAAGVRDEFSCLVCCLDPSPDYLKLLDEGGIDHVDLQIPSLNTPRALLRYVAFERIVDRFQPDIVHAYSFAGDILGTLLRARGFNLQFVTSRRGEDTNRRHQRIRRVTNRWSSRIVCVSSEIAEFVKATERPATGLLEVIPNGVPIGAAGPRQTAPVRQVIRFGTLGTVKPIKGTDLLVEAFMKFGSNARVELAVAGLIDRPWAEALRTRASADRRIEFVGRASNPNAFLAGLDVFVLPSRSEGMSNALLEAMAQGLPCVATDVGSNRSLLHPSHSGPAGIICEPTGDAIYQAMNQLANCADTRERYGTTASQIARAHYTAEEMVHRYDHLYRDIARLDLNGGDRRRDAVPF